MGLVNAAPVCMGLLSSTGPQIWHPASQDIKDVCTEAREYCNVNIYFILKTFLCLLWLIGQ